MSYKNSLHTPIQLIAFTLLFGLSACGNDSGDQGSGAQLTPVSVAEVVVREVTPWQEFSGRIEAKEIVLVRPRVGGVIDAIHYREGDPVRQGDLLFVIDQQPFRAELERAEAELERARAEAKLAKLESRRARDLVKRKLLSEGEYDQRIATENQANANVRSAQASVELARLNLAYTEVRSPIDGRTGRAMVTRGNLVSSDPTPDTLTTIMSLDPIYVVFDSDELTYLRYFGKSQQTESEGTNPKRKVYVGLGNEQDFTRLGQLDFVDNQITPGTGTIRMRAVLDNKDHTLTPGLFARVKLLASQPEPMMLVSDTAILTDQDRKYVYVLGEKNQAVRKDIRIGRSIDGLRIVSEGLKPGDKVIVHGIQKIFFPNMPVAPQMIKMGDPPAMPASAPDSQPEAGH
jgi:multidrug efflux system membrane fusion protein